MSDIAKRLQAALRHDVLNGDAQERAILANQIQEAIWELDRLTKQIETTETEVDAEITRLEKIIEKLGG